MIQIDPFIHYLEFTWPLKGSLDYPKKDTKNCQYIRYLDPWVQIYRELEDAITITTKKQFLQSDLGHIEFSCLLKNGVRFENSI